MVKDFSKRVKHFEEAVVKGIDRPQWHPEKAATIYETWKDEAEVYAQLESELKSLLAELGVPTALRGLYYSFGRRIFKMLYKLGATRTEIDATVEYWARRGLDRRILTRIVNYIGRFITGGARARR